MNLKIHLCLPFKTFCAFIFISIYLTVLPNLMAQENRRIKKNEILLSPEKLPEFKGGYIELQEFLKGNIEYPQKAIEENISGKVYMRFVVKKDGSLSGLEVVKGIGGGCDEEAIRVLLKSPKWKPGEQSGSPVNAWMSLPINFKIPKEGEEQYVEEKFETENDTLIGVVPQPREYMGEAVYMSSDIWPEFPGGDVAMKAFIKNNLCGRDLVDNFRELGTVFIQFVVYKDGSLGEPLVLKGIGGGCDKEAIRMVKSFPKWKPGEQLGEPVSSWMTIPVNFNITIDNQEHNDEEVTASRIDEDRSVIEGVRKNEVSSPGIMEDEEILRRLRAELMPRFPGGVEALREYLRINLQQPSNPENEFAVGTVYVKFIVKKDGTISEPEILKSDDERYNEEAIRLVRGFPNWKPGIVGGEATDVWYCLPIKFDKKFIKE